MPASWYVNRGTSLEHLKVFTTSDTTCVISAPTGRSRYTEIVVGLMVVLVETVVQV